MILTIRFICKFHPTTWKTPVNLKFNFPGGRQKTKYPVEPFMDTIEKWQSFSINGHQRVARTRKDNRMIDLTAPIETYGITTDITHLDLYLSLIHISEPTRLGM